MYYTITLSKFYPVQLKSVFSISVVNSVDPDEMTSERYMLIRIYCFQKLNQQDKGQLWVHQDKGKF